MASCVVAVAGRGQDYTYSLLATPAGQHQYGVRELTDRVIVHLPAPTPLAWTPARAEDGPHIAELRAEVLRASLERLGRYDDVRVWLAPLASCRAVSHRKSLKETPIG